MTEPRSQASYMDMEYTYPPTTPLETKRLQDAMVREQAIAIEEMKILRERVRDCYFREGVNHMENCQEIARAYLERLKQPNYGRLEPGQ